MTAPDEQRLSLGLLQEAARLPETLDSLLDLTPPASLQRAELVARLEKLRARFAPPAEEPPSTEPRDK